VGKPSNGRGKRFVPALAAAVFFVALISSQTLLTASTVAEGGNVNLSEYAATIGLEVTAIDSKNGGAVAGTAEMGDTFTVTFNHALDPTSIPPTGTISLTGSGSITTITISGLTAPIGFDVSKYEANKTTSSAGVAFAFGNGNRTVTATITSAFTNPSGVQAGRASSFTFTPSATITDVSGTAATGSYTTPSALLLF
jgi:hypothetical protein